jgi:hypothetical protein
MHSYNTKICVQMFWPSAQTPYPNNANFKPKLKKKRNQQYTFSMRKPTQKKEQR